LELASRTRHSPINRGHWGLPLFVDVARALAHGARVPHSEEPRQDPARALAVSALDLFCHADHPHSGLADPSYGCRIVCRLYNLTRGIARVIATANFCDLRLLRARVHVHRDAHLLRDGGPL